MRRKILAASVFLCALTCHAFAPAVVQAQCTKEQTIALSPEKSKQVDELITSFLENDKSGAAVSVIQNGERQHQKGYGLADINRQYPICSDTLFDLASTSKQFTAMAILMLKDKELLNLDSSIRDVLPESKFPAWAQAITVRHLLNHISGLPNYDDVLYPDEKPEQQEALDKVFNRVSATIDKNWPRSSKPDGEAVIEPTSADVVRLLALQAKPRFAAGAKWEYSNTGYMLLAQIVEHCTGKRFADFLKENIFQPLGMSSTFVMDERQKNKPANPKRAISYDRGWKEYHDIDYTPLNYIYGDGNVNTNLEDMFKWEQALEAMLRPDVHPGERQLVSSQTINEVFKLNTKYPYQFDDVTNIARTRYGYGWYSARARGVQLIWHAGAWVGFRTMIMFFPEQRFSVILLSNNMQFPLFDMAFKIARLYLEPVLIPVRRVSVSIADIRPLLKRHFPEGGGFYDVTLESDGRLALKTSSREKYILIPESSREFFIEGFEDYDVFRYSFKNIDKVELLPETKFFKQQQRIQ